MLDRAYRDRRNSPRRLARLVLPCYPLDRSYLDPPNRLQRQVRPGVPWQASDRGDFDRRNRLQRQVRPGVPWQGLGRAYLDRQNRPRRLARLELPYQPLDRSYLRPRHRPQRQVRPGVPRQPLERSRDSLCRRNACHRIRVHLRPEAERDARPNVRPRRKCRWCCAGPRRTVWCPARRIGHAAGRRNSLDAGIVPVTRNRFVRLAYQEREARDHDRLEPQIVALRNERQLRKRRIAR